MGQVSGSHASPSAQLESGSTECCLVIPGDPIVRRTACINTTRGTDWLLLAIAAFVLLSVLSVKTLRRRLHARAIQCQNNLKQLALATLNYHASYKQFPMGAGGTGAGGEKPSRGNHLSLSAWVALLPFYDEQKAWEQISNPFDKGGLSFPPMGPHPRFDPQRYTPWAKRPTALACPDDLDHQTRSQACSYVLNYGDAIYLAGDLCGYFESDFRKITTTLATHRGVFARERKIRIRDIIDGTSNTLLFAEARIAGLTVAKDIAGLAENPSLALGDFSDDQRWSNGRDSVWCDGRLRSAGFQTILSPGSPSATSSLGEHTSVMSASSHHGDGVHVAFSDAQVRFVASTIDHGDPSSPSVGPPPQQTGGAKLLPPGSQSPYGVWGAMGTRSMREKISRDQVEAVIDPNQPNPITPTEATRNPLITPTKPKPTPSPNPAPPAILKPGQAKEMTPSNNVATPAIEATPSQTAPPKAIDSPTNPSTTPQTPPPRDWNLATKTKDGSPAKVTGWIVSCSDEGDVVLKTPKGQTMNLTLADFSSQDAYRIVADKRGDWKRAVDELPDQIQAAVSLLEDRKFNAFVQRYYHPNLTTAEQREQILARVSARRGDLIQIFEDAIRSIDNGDYRIEVTDQDRTAQGFSAEIKSATQDSQTPLSMMYLKGAWYISVADGES